MKIEIEIGDHILESFKEYLIENHDVDVTIEDLKKNSLLPDWIKSEIEDNYGYVFSDGFAESDIDMADDLGYGDDDDDDD